MKSQEPPDAPEEKAKVNDTAAVVDGSGTPKEQDELPHVPADSPVKTSPGSFAVVPLPSN